MTRVLFVDDEPALLRGFERGFTRARPAWEPVFALDGVSALATLATTACEVVVSDQSMPGMDGVTLLGEVRARHPHITRIVLSGHVSSIPDPRALGIVHQWWGKPRTTKQLVEGIDRVLWAQSLVVDAAVRAVGLALASAPSPSLSLRAIADAATPDEMLRAVASDPAVSAKVLQAANGSFVGDAQRVSSLEIAIATLGGDAVQTIARGLGVSSPDALPLAERARHVARLAAELAPAGMADDARAAGLLHVLGRLVLEGADAQRAARFAGMLIATWQLPIEVARAVAYHVDPAAAPDPEDPLLLALVRAAA